MENPTPPSSSVFPLPSARLAQLNITLPTPAKPVAAYIPARQVGNLLYISGQLPMQSGQLTCSGPVPSVISPETAQIAARLCAINAIAAAVGHLGSVDRIVGVIRVGAWVASDASFSGQPGIVNGASELLVQIFGDSGKHARAAVGTNVLPLGATVELEVLFEVR